MRVFITLLGREMYLFHKGINNFGMKLRKFHESCLVYSFRQDIISNNGTTNVLTKEQANILAEKLTPEERNILMTVLNKYKSMDDKASYEAQLAGIRWRSKLGRPTKLPTLGDVDPTGSYCPLPENWLLHKSVENDARPSNRVLLKVAFINSIPFIAFGFLDNAIMIVAGDYIEMFLSNKFPISTMAAAALGNTVSDIIGIGSTNWVESLVEKVGIKRPYLSNAQSKLRRTRMAVNLGRVVGITIGCLIGMITIPAVDFFCDR
ncbi:transmembrane protein 65 [Vespa velutina]|uniref:transmembrane protein 65 n=1 Tax=Vespa velutina TaxID=202808 RepID=UPI001FB522F9|nr:transmembrane protein 65 [Vespa velutina]